MFRLNKLQKYAAAFLLLVFFAQLLAVPLSVYAQQSPGSGSSAGSTAVLASIGALAAGVLAFCIAQAAKEVKIFGFGIGKIFQCSITNPPGVHLLSADGLKKWIFDPAARVIIRALLQATTQQIVSWIQNDGGKNVGYVKNLEQALRREADAAGGEFLNNLTGINLCGNIGAYLRITLRTPGLRQRLECSVTDIVRNVDNFYRDFQQGGWPAFIRISLEPQNNPYGAYLIALDAKIEAEARRQQGFLEPLKRSYPFLGFRVPKEVCNEVESEAIESAAIVATTEEEVKQIEEITESLSGTGTAAPGKKERKKICHNEFETKTPGQLISDGLSKATFGGLDFAWAAKEFDEAISVIINALINKLVTTAFAGDSAATSGQGLFDPGFNNIEKENLTESVIGKRINDGLFTADAGLALADAELAADRKDLFAAKKKLDELATTDPSGTLPETQELKNKASDLQTSINSTLEIKKKILFSQFDFIILKRALEEDPSPAKIQDIAQTLPNMILTLGNTISQLGVLPTTGISSGNNKQDLQDIVRGAKVNLTGNLALVDDTGKEIDRVLTGNISDAKRQELTLSRSALITHRALIKNQFYSFS